MGPGARKIALTRTNVGGAFQVGDLSVHTFVTQQRLRRHGIPPTNQGATVSRRSGSGGPISFAAK